MGGSGQNGGHLKNSNILLNVKKEVLYAGLAVGGGIYLGIIPRWLVGLVLGVLVLGVGAIVIFQENILYIPVIEGWKTPADNPFGYHHPGQKMMSYEDVVVDTPDGEKIHGWFVPAPSKTTNPATAPTVLFCHENAGNIGLRLEEAQLVHQRLRVNLLLFDYREYANHTDSQNRQTDRQAGTTFAPNSLSPLLLPPTATATAAATADAPAAARCCWEWVLPVLFLSPATLPPPLLCVL